MSDVLRSVEGFNFDVNETSESSGRVQLHRDAIGRKTLNNETGVAPISDFQQRLAETELLIVLERLKQNQMLQKIGNNRSLLLTSWAEVLTPCSSSSSSAAFSFIYFNSIYN